MNTIETRNLPTNDPNKRGTETLVILDNDEGLPCPPIQWDGEAWDGEEEPPRPLIEWALMELCTERGKLTPEVALERLQALLKRDNLHPIRVKWNYIAPEPPLRRFENTVQNVTLVTRDPPRGDTETLVTVTDNEGKPIPLLEWATDLVRARETVSPDRAMELLQQLLEGGELYPVSVTWKLLPR